MITNFIYLLFCGQNKYENVCDKVRFRGIEFKLMSHPSKIFILILPNLISALSFIYFIEKTPLRQRQTRTYHTSHGKQLYFKLSDKL